MSSALDREVRVLLPKQVHGTEILDVRSDSSAPQCSKEADGWFVHPGYSSSTIFGIQTADCFPVILVGGAFVSILHCGWRGIAAGILSKAIELFRTYGIGEEKIRVATGPGACVCCYQVGSDLISELFRADSLLPLDRSLPKYVQNRAESGLFLNLQGLIHDLLMLEGILPVNYVHMDRCTICSPDYFSFRREKTESGRQLSFILGRSL